MRVKNINLEVTYDSEDINICADKQKYQQILYNLFSNAIKFTDEGGKVNLNITNDEDYIFVTIKDNGIGIDSKYHGKIFAKFQQVDSSYTRKYGSTGLGLAITKELVELHEGNIWLESRLNEGTKFTFKLPKNRLNNEKNNPYCRR